MVEDIKVVSFIKLQLNIIIEEDIVGDIKEDIIVAVVERTLFAIKEDITEVFVKAENVKVGMPEVTAFDLLNKYYFSFC